MRFFLNLGPLAIKKNFYNYLVKIVLNIAGLNFYSMLCQFLKFNLPANIVNIETALKWPCMPIIPLLLGSAVSEYPSSHIAIIGPGSKVPS